LQHGHAKVAVMAQRQDRAEENEPDEHQAGQFFGGGETGIEHVAQHNVAKYEHHHDRQRERHQVFNGALQARDEGIHCCLQII
jgi:hypothetical protein